MQRSSKKVTAILVVLCLLFGGVGLAPEIANTTGSPVAKAATKKTMYVKWTKAKVYKKRSASSGVVAVVKHNKKVTMITSADKNGWVKIKLSSGKKGYIKKKQLSSKTFKQRSLSSLKAALKALLPEIASAGWEITAESSYQWTSEGYYEDVTLAKGDYKIELAVYATLNEDYSDGRIKNRYPYQLFKNGKFQEISLSGPKSALLKVLNMY